MAADLCRLALPRFLRLLSTRTASEASEIRFQGLRTVQLLSCGQSRCPGNAEINSYRRLVFAFRFGPFHLDRNGNQPAVRLPADRGGKHFPNKAHRFSHSQLAEARDAKAPSSHPKSSRTVVQPGPVVLELLLKLRIAGRALQESLERLAEVLDGLLRHTLGYVQPPRKLLALDGLPLPPPFARIRLFPGLLWALPLRPCPVIRQASYPNRLAQQNFLLGRGIECNSMAQNHCHGRASMALAARFRAARCP